MSRTRTLLISRTDRREQASGSRCAWTVSLLSVLVLASPLLAQVSYTFSSGFNGDGFDWPASPTGLLSADAFYTPEGIEFINYTGNNVFFDSQYQVIGNAPGFSGDALWGNPLDLGYGAIDISFYGYGPVQRIAFDFAWSVAGSPWGTPDSVYVHFQDSEGHSTTLLYFLPDTFTGFDGGSAGHLAFSAVDLTDDYTGEPFVDIQWMSVDLWPVITDGPSSEYGIDNFVVDGHEAGSGELYPSVYTGSGLANVSGGTLGHSFLRGSGTAFVGIQVTNGTENDTTFSTILEPGGDLDDAGQISHSFIAADQTLYTPSVVSIDRAKPSGTYESQITVVNDLNPFDPDDTVTLAIYLFDPPSLTAPSPVDVTAEEKIQLGNATAPANGYRAAVKVTDRSIIGPFAVAGLMNGAAVKPGETVQAAVTLNRFGQLSGNHDGTFTASLQMTAFMGIYSVEILLAEAEPIPDVSWMLQATLTDTLADSLAYAPGDPLGPGRIGVNSAKSAATIVGGVASANGNVHMALSPVAGDEITGVLGHGVETSFTSTVPVHVVQWTYGDEDLCPAIVEANLRLLFFDADTGTWKPAVHGNSDGGAGAAFHAGSFQAFANSLGGAPLSSVLGAHGVDTVNNHIWAVVDHQGLFGIGEPGRSCTVRADFDRDGDVDEDDLELFTACAAGPAVPVAFDCEDKDLTGDGDADSEDFAVFQRCYSGPDTPVDPNCAG